MMRAGQSYEEGIRRGNWRDSPTDKEVYAYLKGHGCEACDEESMPSFRTWQRYLREYRRATGRQKRLFSQNCTSQTKERQQVAPWKVQ